MGDNIPAGQVAVTNDAGETGLISAEDAEKWARQGLVRAATSDELKQEQVKADIDRFRGGAGAVFAGGAGLARGLTGGFSDPAAIAAARYFGGKREAEDLKTDLEYAKIANQGVTTAADVAGMAAGTFLSGGIGGAASAPVRGAEALGHGITHGLQGVLGGGRIATIGAKTLGMGAEMAALGAERTFSEQLSETFSEDVLGTHALNAEHIASAAAKDFLIGAAFGGVLGIASTMGTPSHVSRLFRKGARETEHAAEAEARATADASGGGMAGSKVTVEHVPGEAMGERLGTARSVMKKALAGTPLENIVEHGDFTQEGIANFLDDASAQGMFQGAGRNVKVVEKLDKSFEGGALAAAKRARTKIPEVLGLKGPAGLTGPADMARGAGLWAKEAGEEMGVREATFAGLDKHLPKTTAQDVFGSLAKKAESSFGKIGQESEFSLAQRTIESLKRQTLGLERGAQLTPEIEAQLAGKVVGLSDIREMVKSIASSTDRTAVKATDEMRIALNHMVDDKLQLIAKTNPKMADAYTGWKAAKQDWLAAKMFEKLATKGKAQTAQNVFGGIPGMVMGGIGAAAGGLVAGPGGAALGFQAGSLGAAYLRRRAPYLIAEYGQRGKILQLADSLTKLDKETVSQAKSLLDPLKPAGHKVSVETFGAGYSAAHSTAHAAAHSGSAFARATQFVGHLGIHGGHVAHETAMAAAEATRVDDAIEALQNGKVQQHIAERMAPLAEHAPKTAGAVAEKFGKMAAYMLATAPQPRPYDPLFPGSPGAKYNPNDVDAWNKKWAILGDWTTVMRAAKDGTVTPGMVDTLKTLYPEKYKATQAAFMGLLFGDQAQKKLKEMPVERRLSIATLWDIPTTVTDPEFLHAVHQSQQEQGAEKTPGPDQAPQRQRTSGDAKAASNVAESMRTDSEDLAHGVGSD